jgi:hypothetical protein
VFQSSSAVFNRRRLVQRQLLHPRGDGGGDHADHCTVDGQIDSNDVSMTQEQTGTSLK